MKLTGSLSFPPESSHQTQTHKPPSLQTMLARGVKQMLRPAAAAAVRAQVRLSGMHRYRSVVQSMGTERSGVCVDGLWCGRSLCPRVRGDQARPRLKLRGGGGHFLLEHSPPPPPAVPPQGSSPPYSVYHHDNPSRLTITPHISDPPSTLFGRPLRRRRPRRRPARWPCRRCRSPRTSPGPTRTSPRFALELVDRATV
jgi:hypothetical protein